MGEQARAQATTGSGARVATIAALFTDGDDYLTELDQDKELIERGIVRVQRATRLAHDGAGSEAFIESSAIVDGRLVRLRQPCGTLWGFGDSDQQVHDRVREDLFWLGGELRKLGLDVRAGLWQEQ